MTDHSGPDFQIHMARVYLCESRRSSHRGWSFTLLEWAGKCRRAMAMKRRAPVQPDLFGGEP